jgi:AraC-like DNA-binding protein
MSGASRVHTVHSRWTRNIVALAVAEGADEEALWSAAGLVPDTLGDDVMEEAHLRVWEAIMRALESPGFPIRVASRRSIDEYALLGLACKTSDAVRDALGHLIRFTGVWRSQYRCALIERASSADLVLKGPTGSLGRRCTNESAVAQILKAIRDVSRTRVDPIRVSFRHAAPADVGEHELFFGCDVQFEAPFDGLTLSTSTLDSKLLLADDALSTFLVGQLEQLARKLVSSEPLSDKVRGAISRLLPGGAPNLEAVAAALAMSPRTLQRQLSAADTSFARLVDETRHHLATELLAHGDRPVAEISFILGFSEPSAFHRAFKRWTGTTPTLYRAG